MKYRYEAFDKHATVKCGEIEASGEEAAGVQVRELGLFIQKLEPMDGSPMKTVLPGAAEQVGGLVMPKTNAAPLKGELADSEFQDRSNNQEGLDLGALLRREATRLKEFEKGLPSMTAAGRKRLMERVTEAAMVGVYMRWRA